MSSAPQSRTLLILEFDLIHHTNSVSSAFAGLHIGHIEESEGKQKLNCEGEIMALLAS